MAVPAGPPIPLLRSLLLPFATAWIACTRLASSPVTFYAGLFVCIDIAYNFFEHEVFACADTGVYPRVCGAGPGDDLSVCLRVLSTLRSLQSLRRELDSR